MEGSFVFFGYDRRIIVGLFVAVRLSKVDVSATTQSRTVLFTDLQANVSIKLWALIIFERLLIGGRRLDAVAFLRTFSYALNFIHLYY